MKGRTIIALLVLVGLCGIVYYKIIPIFNVKISPLQELPFFSVKYCNYSSDPLQSLNKNSDSGTIEQDMKNIKKIGFDGIKVDFNFGFNNRQSSLIADMAAKQGLYTIGALVGHVGKQINKPYNEKELQKWEEYVRENVKRNKNVIYFWEVWNEPDINLFKYGSPEEFLELLKRTHKIIREENEKAKIIVNLDESVVDKGAREFTDKILSLGGGDYFDIISFHPYGVNPYIQEEIIKKSIIEQKRLVERYNNKWVLCISEMGQPISQVDEKKQAELAEMVLKEIYESKIPIVWFHYSNQRMQENGLYGTGWGLIRPDGTYRPIMDRIIEFLNQVKNK